MNQPIYTINDKPLKEFRIGLMTENRDQILVLEFMDGSQISVTMPASMAVRMGKDIMEAGEAVLSPTK